LKVSWILFEKYSRLLERNDDPYRTLVVLKLPDHMISWDFAKTCGVNGKPRRLVINSNIFSHSPLCDPESSITTECINDSFLRLLILSTVYGKADDKRCPFADAALDSDGDLVLFKDA